MSKGIGIAVLGLGLLGLGWWAHGHHGPRIQDHVRQLAETAVAPSIHGATATVSGRDIHLSGIADSKAEAEYPGEIPHVQLLKFGRHRRSGSASRTDSDAGGFPDWWEQACFCKRVQPCQKSNHGRGKKIHLANRQAAMAAVPFGIYRWASIPNGSKYPRQQKTLA